MKTIEEGKNYLRANYEKGCVCPCCGQYVKAYWRNIYSTVARDLIHLYRLQNNEDRYYHISDIRTSTSGGGDLAKLISWGLVEEMPKDPNNVKQRTSGYWKITEKGKRFVENTLKVEKYAVYYNNKLLRYEGRLVGIKDCLSNKFNYEELMSN
jgi:hypothetical protein